MLIERKIYIERKRESAKVEKVGREREENWVWTLDENDFYPKEMVFIKKKKACYERENENGEERNERGFKKLGERK